MPLTSIAGAIQLILSAQGCNGKTYNIAGVGPTTINLNQQGVTGSWYQPATSGQGIEVEIYPNLAAGASGYAQVSWFTYDGVVGGVDHQRWYTLGGPVPTGQPASLTIYQNVGGNFNALPVTTAQAVGSATLGFDSCTSGQLSYTFSDGSGRTGVVPLTRITQNVTCSPAGASSTNADFAFSGNWYDPSTSGQGITVEVNPTSNALFLAVDHTLCSGRCERRRCWTTVVHGAGEFHAWGAFDTGTDLPDHGRRIQRIGHDAAGHGCRRQRHAVVPEMQQRDTELCVLRRLQRRRLGKHRAEPRRTGACWMQLLRPHASGDSSNSTNTVLAAVI